ncbi:hypothetical protein L3Q82_021699 [Scortum barcoo]|uniref:Uncharacterized protein n=1 Tax=Scortum barcoo TaxID=214431 RepID=A0ACB8X572_9TELE|nr:hypothetical protein L3Q82_021699 [Scortum barcoo]
MPSGACRFGDQVGFKAYHWIGDPWDIDGHALLVLTDDKPESAKPDFPNPAGRAERGRSFRMRLKKGGPEDWARAEEQRQVVMISGNRLPYYAVMCLPIEEYPGKERLKQITCSGQRGKVQERLWRSRGQIRPHHRGRSAPAGAPQSRQKIQYPLNPGAVEEMDKIVREDSAP